MTNTFGTTLRVWLVCLVCSSTQTYSADADKPNVIVILTDDQGWGDLSVHGNTNISTPNIDRLASQGMALDRFYVCPICSPTRAEFMTGRYNPSHRRQVCQSWRRTHGFERDDRVRGFQNRRLQNCGVWQSGTTGCSHLIIRMPGVSMNTYGFCSGHWGHYYSPMLEHNGQIVTGDGFVIDDFTNRAMNYIEVHKEEPFFVYLALLHPSLADAGSGSVGGRNSRTTTCRFELAKINRRICPHARAALAMCENIDWNVGRRDEENSTNLENCRQHHRHLFLGQRAQRISLERAI